ncbi:MAG: TonB-dependent receptor, partial [Bacteroidetes bacterium]|nr:TonB-dependent receptor [Bacteroidota bacterium]
IYSKGNIYNTFSGLEPRVSLAYNLNETSSVKAAYTRNFQYVHLAQNSTAGTPLDIWFPSSPNVKPQIGDQFSLGYFKNFNKSLLETSLEGFYKLNHNAIDFKNHAELLLNEYLEGELRFGKAWSYGIEAFVRKTDGRLNGWLSYTWSRTLREMEAINDGRKYPASYDRPHDISLVLNYLLSDRLSLGANWVYATGSPVTFPTGRFVIGNTIAPVYSDRNSYRLPDYHRLDLSLTYTGKKKERQKWLGEWNLSVYNAYNRKNPWVINFVADPNIPNATFAEMTYLFGIVPAITYNFKF